MTTDLTTVRLLLAVADTGSFNRAASLVGIKDSNVSRRMAALESAAGVPLFLRRTTGTELTEAGRQLVDAAEVVMDSMTNFDAVLGSLANMAQRPVTVSAPEGLTSYILAPLASGFAPASSPIRFPRDLPPMAFLPLGMPADIELLLVQPGAPVQRPPAHIVRKLGTMQFRPAAARSYLEQHDAPQSLKDIGKRPIIQHAGYGILPAFTRWAELVAESPTGPLVTVSTSSALHRATLSGNGISLLPTFSELLDQSVVLLPVGEPIGIEVWAAAEPETLRLPTAKRAWESLCAGFSGSVWFNAG